LALRRIEEASGIAGELLSETRSTVLTSKDDLGVLRALSIVLDHEGHAACARGNLDEAEKAYRETLVIWRRLDANLPGVEDNRTGIERMEKAIASLRPHAPKKP